MGSAVAVNIALESIHCASCGMVFGAPDDYIERRRSDGQAFYCPAGHTNVYNGGANKWEKEAKRLEAELQKERERREMAARTHASEIRGERIRRGKAEAKLKRTETRVHAGVCPHCNRTFQQLARHMQTQHREVAPHTHEVVPR